MRSRMLATALACAVLAPAPPQTWEDVVSRYATVRDYTCRYVKEERAISGGEPQTIRLAFRKPFDVRMEWLDEHGKVDQVAVYRQGMNDGKVIARRSGMLGSLVGTVRLDPRDKRALEDSRHPITEVGLGPLIEAIAAALRDGHARMSNREEEPDGSVRFAFEIAPGASLLDIRDARRITVVVGAAGLPVDVQILDPSGARIERHRFSDIAVNVGLGDAVFTL